MDATGGSGEYGTVILQSVEAKQAHSMRMMNELRRSIPGSMLDVYQFSLSKNYLATTCSRSSTFKTSHDGLGGDDLSHGHFR